MRAQRTALRKLGVDTGNIYTDRGNTGRNRERPGLSEALAAVGEGDTLVVTKLDRLGRSVTDLHAIVAELDAKGARLVYGGSVYNPGDPAGKMFFSILAAMAEFEADLTRARTREGVAIAKEQGRMTGRKPTPHCAATRTLTRRLRSRKVPGDNAMTSKADRYAAAQWFAELRAQL